MNIGQSYQGISALEHSQNMNIGQSYQGISALLKNIHRRQGNFFNTLRPA